MSTNLSEVAKLLHTKMIQTNAQKQYSVEELLKMSKIEKETELMVHLQELMNLKLIKLSKVGTDLRFQPISIGESEKIRNMNDDEAMIYSYIEASAREGIWTKTLKAKTNLHQHIVNKCLKNLETQGYIKSIKSVKHPTRKIYMLYHLQPSIDVTGGPWFTDSELDTEFINTLLHVIWLFIVKQTFPSSKQFPNLNPLQSSFTKSSFIGVDLDSILNYINTSDVTSVELELKDVNALCDVLKFDDKIEEVETGYRSVYKATRQSINEAGLTKNIDDIKDLIPESNREYLIKNKTFSIFDFKNVENVDIDDNNDNNDDNEFKDDVYLDSFLNV
ncbi:RPC34 [Candida pseudojiufengensis]|uniref:RPC34 n=1 Tax=Candida pseudojiufengensis TaxID=497109 RepID=UPI0022249D7A|nr:RPC34 [Candida pseudojiufengensis]KAI5963153.1 RPC34 [Candida pseudojiufengensis]